MKYKTAWAETAAQNQFLKVMTLLLAILTSVLGVLSANLALRDPLIIERGGEQTKLLSANRSAHSLVEIKEFISVALAQRVDSSGDINRNYFSAEELRNHSKEIRNMHERDIVQQFVSGQVEVDGDTADVKAHRIISYSGVTSIFPFNLGVKIQKTSRTKVNPYGLIITRVSEIKDDSRKEKTQK